VGLAHEKIGARASTLLSQQFRQPRDVDRDRLRLVKGQLLGLDGFAPT
jgi:hypothetical protein